MNLIKIILTFGCIIVLYSCADYNLKDQKKKGKDSIIHQMDLL